MFLAVFPIAVLASKFFESNAILRVGENSGGFEERHADLLLSKLECFRVWLVATFLTIAGEECVSRFLFLLSFFFYFFVLNLFVCSFIYNSLGISLGVWQLLQKRDQYKRGGSTTARTLWNLCISFAQSRWNRTCPLALAFPAAISRVFGCFFLVFFFFFHRIFMLLVQVSFGFVCFLLRSFIFELVRLLGSLIAKRRTTWGLRKWAPKDERGPSINRAIGSIDWQTFSF